MTTKVTNMNTAAYNDVLNDVKHINPQHAKFIKYCDKNNLDKRDYATYQSFQEVENRSVDTDTENLNSLNKNAKNKTYQRYANSIYK